MVGKYKAYPEYKDSGVGWLGNIPKHWEANKTKWYCKVTDGSHHSPDIQLKGYPFISVTDIGENKIDFCNAKKISKSDYYRLVREGCKPSVGDILLTKDGTIGRACLVNVSMPDFVILSSLGLLTPKQQVLNKFLYYYLISGINIDQMNSMIHGSALRRMTINKINELLFICPEISEQQNIANFLDYETSKIDMLIEKQQQLIKLLEEKRQAVISQAVTKGLNPNVSMKDSGVEWLGEIPEHWLSVGFKKYLNPIVDYRGKTPEKVEDGIFLVTARNIKAGKINYSLSHEFIKEVDYKDIMRRGIPKIGDVIFTTEAPLGEVANIDNENIALAQRIIKFRGKDQIVDNYYLKYFIMSDQFQQGLNTYATGSTAQGIKAERLGYLSLLIPPYKEQSNIVNYLDLEILKLNQLMVKANKVIELLKERRTALISAAVTGKIDVRDWQAPTVTD